MAEEVMEEYESSLQDLTFNSKPQINMLTMLAEDNAQYAEQIVEVIGTHIKKARSTEKLPCLYLIDSILKNVDVHVPDAPYLPLFAQSLVANFSGVFEKVDEKTRQAMFKLRQTWADLFANKLLFTLDTTVNQIDPAWPVTAVAPESPVPNIHVNPKFLLKQEEAKAQERLRLEQEQEQQEAAMRQKLLAKQQELLKLQQQQLELELAETKTRLHQQETQLQDTPVQDVTKPAGRRAHAPKPKIKEQQAASHPVIPSAPAGRVAHVPKPPPRDPRQGRPDPRRDPRSVSVTQKLLQPEQPGKPPPFDSRAKKQTIKLPPATERVTEPAILPHVSQIVTEPARLSPVSQHVTEPARLQPIPQHVIEPSKLQPIPQHVIHPVTQSVHQPVTVPLNIPMNQPVVVLNRITLPAHSTRTFVGNFDQQVADTPNFPQGRATTPTEGAAINIEDQRASVKEVKKKFPSRTKVKPQKQQDNSKYDKPREKMREDKHTGKRRDEETSKRRSNEVNRIPRKDGKGPSVNTTEDKFGTENKRDRDKRSNRGSHRKRNSRSITPENERDRKSKNRSTRSRSPPSRSRQSRSSQRTNSSRVSGWKNRRPSEEEENAPKRRRSHESGMEKDDFKGDVMNRREDPKGGMLNKRGRGRGNTNLHGRRQESNRFQRGMGMDVGNMQEPLDQHDSMNLPKHQDSDAPPPKKSKQEQEEAKNKLPNDLADLFGSEDQDLRKMTVIPKLSARRQHSLQPSMIRAPLPSPSQVGWAKFKANRPEEFPFSKPPPKKEIPSLISLDIDFRTRPPAPQFHSTPQRDEQFVVRQGLNRSISLPLPLVSPEVENLNIPSALKLNQANEILRQADDLVKAGKLSHEQHQGLLKQLGLVYRLQTVHSTNMSFGQDNQQVLRQADDLIKAGKLSHEQHQGLLKQLGEVYRLQTVQQEIGGLEGARNMIPPLGSPPLHGPQLPQDPRSRTGQDGHKIRSFQGPDPRFTLDSSSDEELLRSPTFENQFTPSPVKAGPNMKSPEGMRQWQTAGTPENRFRPPPQEESPGGEWVGGSFDSDETSPRRAFNEWNGQRGKDQDTPTDMRNSPQSGHFMHGPLGYGQGPAEFKEEYQIESSQKGPEEYKQKSSEFGIGLDHSGLKDKDLRIRTPKHEGLASKHPKPSEVFQPGKGDVDHRLLDGRPRLEPQQHLESQPEFRNSPVKDPPPNWQNRPHPEMSEPKPDVMPFKDEEEARPVDHDYRVRPQPSPLVQDHDERKRPQDVPQKLGLDQTVAASSDQTNRTCAQEDKPHIDRSPSKLNDVKPTDSSLTSPKNRSPSHAVFAPETSSPREYPTAQKTVTNDDLDLRSSPPAEPKPSEHHSPPKNMSPHPAGLSPRAASPSKPEVLGFAPRQPGDVPPLKPGIFIQPPLRTASPQEGRPTRPPSAEKQSSPVPPVTPVPPVAERKPSPEAQHSGSPVEPMAGVRPSGELPTLGEKQHQQEPAAMQPPMAEEPATNIPEIATNVPSTEAGYFFLPYDDDKYYIPVHDSRWLNPPRSFKPTGHEVGIDQLRPYELQYDGSPRRMSIIDNIPMEFRADPQKRELFINGKCYYCIGDSVHSVIIEGRCHSVYYQGPIKRLWIDGHEFQIRFDAPPTKLTLAGITYDIRMDSISKDIWVNNVPICKFGNGGMVDIGIKNHEIYFVPPTRSILIDGQLSQLNFHGQFPCVIINGKERGIRFDGPPREIIIDDRVWRLPVHSPCTAKFDGVPHVLAFGGPGHEVIIDGEWYEVKFNGPPKMITVGNRTHKIQLKGSPPEVKILPELIKDPVEIKKLTGDVKIDPSCGIVAGIEILPDGRTIEEGPGAMESGYQAPIPEVPSNGPGNQQPLQGGPGSNLFMPPPPPMPPLITLPTSQPTPVSSAQPHSQGMPMFNNPGGPIGMRPGPGMSGGMFGPQQNTQNVGGPVPLMQQQQQQQQQQQGPLTMPAPPMPPMLPGPMPPPPMMMPGPPPQMMPPQMPHGPQGMPFNLGGMPMPNTGMRPGMGMPHNMMGPPPGYMGGPMGPGPMGNQFNPMNQPRPLMGFAPNQQQAPPVPQPQMASQLDINDLFAQLVKTGIIKQKEEVMQKENDVKKDEKDEKKVEEQKEKTAKIVAAELDQLAEREDEELEDLPDLVDFKLDKMKIKYNGVIQRLYVGIQCSSCGLRFVTEDMEKYREHLDWHFRQNKKDKDDMKVAKFRKWYYALMDWIQFEEIGDMDERAHSAVFEKMLQSSMQPNAAGVGVGLGILPVVQQYKEHITQCPPVSSDPDQNRCVICHEAFKPNWDEDEEEWVLKDAISVRGKTFHPVCYEDAKEQSFLETPTPEADKPDPITDPLAYLASLSQVTPVPTQVAIKAEDQPMSVDSNGELSDSKVLSLPAVSLASVLKQELVPSTQEQTAVTVAPSVPKQEPIDTTISHAQSDTNQNITVKQEVIKTDCSETKPVPTSKEEPMDTNETTVKTEPLPLEDKS